MVRRQTPGMGCDSNMLVLHSRMLQDTYLQASASNTRIPDKLRRYLIPVLTRGILVNVVLTWKHRINFLQCASICV